MTGRLRRGSPRSFTASGLGAYASNWFTGGLITWLSGANDGRTAEVKLHARSGSTVTIELWQQTSEPIAPSDDFRILAGCDKQFATCRAKFNNVPNFRGFPHVPGNDFLLSIATRDGNNDGGSMN